ncbi:heterokaryon incompatibility protein-domain-containing protein [Leptodontidium sp. MPI-SDFR-AT-0119]|nr:heterokaryon incompatibility protein-domain-containing protein [Leptodontidium sp. MPI-SDFR-AT-0119]
MDSRQCDFTPPGEVPKICHSALPRISNQGSNLRYNRLDKAKSEIRVICPHCPVGSSVDKLEFTVRIVSLDDKPKYWALSYVWGDSTEREPLCIEGQTFMATLNLRDALKRVRNVMSAETKDLQLWVDAICINQEDTTEKSWQVSMMSRIYSSAYCINVWLGLADHNATLAMEFVSKIGSTDFNARSPLTDEMYTALCENAIDRSLKKGGGNNLELLWALEDIFHHRPYWKRAWTFQEFCLGTSIIWCGDSFFTLSSAMKFINHTRDMASRALVADPSSGSPSPAVAKFIQCIGDIAGILVDRLKAGAFMKTGYRFVDNYNEGEKLGILLCQTIGRTAQEPKDKIFCLLGLCNVDIRPDYTDLLSVGRLYREASALVLKGISKTELLTAFLSYAGLSNQSQQRAMPSWAVEWDVVAKAGVLFKVANMEANKHFVGGGTPSLQMFNLEILFQCIYIDKVREVYSPPCKRIHDPKGIDLLKFFFNNPTMQILPFILQHQPTYKTGISLLAAVLSTLLIGRDVVSINNYDRLFVAKTPCANFPRNAAILIRLMFSQWECTGTFFVSLETYINLGIASRTELHSPSEEAALNKIINQIFGFENSVESLTGDDIAAACGYIISPADAINFHNKTPFGAHAHQMCGLKSTEGYIGAGRAGVQLGDVVCVLRDADVPFILRGDGKGRFRLVGPAYVEGLMDGEAWEMVCSGEKTVETIVVV